MSHANKRAKTDASDVAPLFSEVDLSHVTIDPKLQGSEVKFAAVKIDGKRLGFQLVDATSSIRVPFAIDDGSKFNSKPTLRFELPAEQLGFVQDGIESMIKDAAVANKKEWFGALKTIPSDDEVRRGLTSRVSESDGKYPPSLKVNLNLGPDAAKKVRVSTARRLENGKITRPENNASPEQISAGCHVIPVLRTAGGVWISVNAKKKTIDYGLSFEASEVLIVEENRGGASGINFGANVESASDAEESE